MKLMYTKLPLATRPGTPNVNGNTYSKEVIESALKEFNGTGRKLYIEKSYPTDYSIINATQVDAMNCCGHIDAIDLDEQIADCTIYSNDMNIMKLIENKCLGLRYIGEIENNIVTKMKIVCYCLMDKPKVGLSSEYGEFNNKGE